MIANISPAGIHAEETLNTLKYASRAKHIKTNAQVNEIENSEKMDDLERLRSEISMLKKQLKGRTALKPHIELSEKLKSFKTAVFQLLKEGLALELAVDHINLKSKYFDSIAMTLATCIPLKQQTLINDFVLELNEELDIFEKEKSILQR